MKNFRQSIIFGDYMVRFCPTTLFTQISSSNSCSVYLSSGISHNLVHNFSIYSSLLQYNNFFVIEFINRLKRDLLKLRFLVPNSAK